LLRNLLQQSSQNTLSYACSLEFLGVLFVGMSKFSDEKIEDFILYVAGLNSNRVQNDHPFCRSMMKHEPVHICPMAWST
jgi:hypothetical protein